jgi:xanthine dehydrogenase accessory factor
MDILRDILQSLETEELIVLATIISTSGSTPASAFSKLLIAHGGAKVSGTVGGGCMEADVLAAAKKCFETHRAEFAKFQLTEDEYLQGLICGGTVEVFMEPITQAHARVFAELAALAENGTDCVLATKVTAEGAVLAKQLFTQESLLKGIANEEGLQDEVQMVFQRGETRKKKFDNAEWILEPVAGTPRLVLFGAGHVARAICKSAAAVGFRVTVIDDRAQYANRERFPVAKEIVAKDFHEALGELKIRNSDYLIISTRGHRDDEEILERVVASNAKYIGMIGSKRKVLTTYKRLLSRGVSVDALKRVCSPMGLEIGAATPEEIAVSVVAELIAVRRNVFDRSTSKSASMQNLVETARHSSSDPPPRPVTATESFVR